MSNGRWMLVDCEGSRSVVNARAVENAEQARPGDSVTLISRGAVNKMATLIMTSDDRKFLESQKLKAACPPTPEVISNPSDEALPETSLFEELRDFSFSETSWGDAVPRASSRFSYSDHDSENDQVNNLSNRLKLDALQRQYTNSKKQQTPTNSAHAVMPQHLQEKLRKLELEKDQSGPSQPRNINEDVVTISRKELNSVNRHLIGFEDTIKHIRGCIANMTKCISSSTDHLYESIYPTGVDATTRFKHPHGNVEEDVGDNCPSTSTNVKDEVTVTPELPSALEIISRTPIKYGELRQTTTSESQSHSSTSDDVSPIVNENQNVHKSSKRMKLSQDNGSGPSGTCIGSNTENVAMVPIGSEKTYVPKSVYDRINWTSYTMATRKLLMAVFPRGTLATHSLTGKASPAFQNKPKKLSLDPKKVFDIVMTVTKKCNVKESLVRQAITTKCADENKMMRIQKEKARKSLGSTPFRNLQNIQENNRRKPKDNNKTC